MIKTFSLSCMMMLFMIFDANAFVASSLNTKAKCQASGGIYQVINGKGVCSVLITPFLTGQGCINGGGWLTVRDGKTYCNGPCEIDGKQIKTM